MHWFYLFALLSFHLNAKVLIITHSYNRPDFIEIQYKTFAKFLQDDYEFVVFNDAKLRSIKNSIDKMCNKLGIRCIRIPQSIHDAPYLPREPGENFNHPCIRCANVVQYSLDILGFDHPGIVMIIDSDMFLIRPFSIQNYMVGYDMAGYRQNRKHLEYVWNGIVFLNMPALADRRSINFNCGKIDGIYLDVGGQIYHYFLSHPNLKLNLMDGMYIKENHQVSLRERSDPNLFFLLNQKPDNIEFFIDYSFFHYRGGGNWDHQSEKYHSEKTSILNAFIDRILKD
jgi:hypothetical protein